MRQFILKLIVGILAIWLAVEFVPKIEFTGPWTILVQAGLFLGLINFFIKPLLKIVSLPLRILTFGLFGLIINMVIIWLVDIFFEGLDFIGIVPLFWTSIIVWGLGLISSLFARRKRQMV